MSPDGSRTYLEESAAVTILPPRISNAAQSTIGSPSDQQRPPPVCTQSGALRGGARGVGVCRPGQVTKLLHRARLLARCGVRRPADARELLHRRPAHRIRFEAWRGLQILRDIA